MKNYRLNAPVELTVAADPGMMLVIRLTTAGVVTRAGLTIDAMDNLKIAAEEACNFLIGQKNPPERILVKYECRDGALYTTVSGLDKASEPGEADEAELEVARCILEALADGVHFDVCNGWVRGIELRSALV